MKRAVVLAALALATALPAAHAQKAHDLMGFALGMSTEQVQAVGSKDHPTVRWERVRDSDTGLPALQGSSSAGTMTLVFSRETSRLIRVTALVKGNFAKDELREALLKKYGKPTKETSGMMTWSFLGDGKLDAKDVCTMGTEDSHCGARLEIMHSGSSRLDAYLVRLWDRQALPETGHVQRPKL